MIKNLTYKYYHTPNSKLAYLVLQGGNYKINTPLMTNIFEALVQKGDNVFTFNFPDNDSSEKSDDQNDLSAAVDTLDGVVKFLKDEGNQNFYIVGKSLGAIVASQWLEKNPEQNVKLAVLGFVVGQLALSTLHQNLDLVIQGEYDRFGNAEAVTNHLKEHNIQTNVIEIPGADHSYNNSNKEPEFQQLAVETLIKNI